MNSPKWTPLHSLFAQTLRKNRLLPKGESLLVAVSGGQDSMCLLKLLIDLQPKWQWFLAIAHCDHRWASDEGMALHVRQMALNWKVPFFLKTAISPIKETEAAARSWRYQCLMEIAKENQFKYIVTGHTQSDRAETLLYNLIRGASADGLTALDWQRNLREFILVRPLLNISRQETGDFCQQQKIDLWEDSANDNLKYVRNRLRKELIPYLANNFNKEVEKHLSQTAEILREEVKYLQESALNLFQEAFIVETQALKRSVLRQQPKALQRRVIKLWLLRIMNNISPNFDQIEGVSLLIDAPNRSCWGTLPGGLIAEVTGELIVFSSKN